MTSPHVGGTEKTSTFELEKASGNGTELQETLLPADRNLSWKNVLNLVAYLLNTIITYTSLTGAFGKTNTELSAKYQTLVTPAGWAFAIWGPIFMWEGVFAVSQMFPLFRNSKVVLAMSPWWWAVCGFQCCWTFAFSVDLITLALIFMFSILISLLGIACSTDRLQLSTSEYFLLRAPLSLQLGWIICAAALNFSVQADALQASQSTLLAIAVLSCAAVLCTSLLFTIAFRTPDPIVSFVAAWAFLGISSELGNPKKLNDEATRFNHSTWDPVILDGLRYAALMISLAALVNAAIAVLLRIFRPMQTPRVPRSGGDTSARRAHGDMFSDGMMGG